MGVPEKLPDIGISQTSVVRKASRYGIPLKKEQADEAIMNRHRTG
jgi:hypothetical protein